MCQRLDGFVFSIPPTNDLIHLTDIDSYMQERETAQSVPLWSIWGWWIAGDRVKRKQRGRRGEYLENDLS